MNRRQYLRTAGLAGLGLPFAWTACQNAETGSNRFDVLVYGATPGGLTAAISAARQGAKVALLSTDAYLGGMHVEGLGGTDINNHGGFRNSEAVGGLALEFYQRMARHYGREADFLTNRNEHETSRWRFESSAASQVIADWLAEFPIFIQREARLMEHADSVEMRGNQLRAIRLENGERFDAKVFIDATVEGDLLFRAGVPTRIGREANAEYGETSNGKRHENTYRQFEVQVDPYRKAGVSGSGLIHTIQSGELEEMGTADERIQAYCFRACLTQDPANRLPMLPPADYQRDWYEIYLRYLRAGGKLYRPRASLPHGKTDQGAWHDLSHNLYGMNHDYPAGRYAQRGQIYREHRQFTQGLFHFLAHDSEVGELAPDLQAEWAKWGPCRDEFMDNDGWPRQIYVRDARRMVSDYVISQQHTMSGHQEAVLDPVAVAYWPPDVHAVRRIVHEGAAYNEGFVFGGESWRPFSISYRALVPPEQACRNLLTPTCPSSSHLAFGAIRLEWTFMALGEACGLAAVIAAQQSESVQHIPFSQLYQQLAASGQVMELSEEEVIEK